MLNAYRKNKRPAAAENLRKMIRKLAQAPKSKVSAKKKGAAKASAKSAKAETSETVWTEYEELAIQKALASENHVYHLVATIDANCAMPIAARQMVLNSMKSVGEVLGIRPDAASPLATKRIELLFASEHSGEKVSSKCSIPTVIADVKCEAVVRKLKPLAVQKTIEPTTVDIAVVDPEITASAAEVSRLR